MRRRWTVVVRGPLAPYGPGFGVLLVSRGYKPASVRCRLDQLNLLSRWLDAQGLGPTGLTDKQVERFVAARRAAGRVSWVSAANFALPLAYLRSVGVVPANDAARSGGALEERLEGYRGYLVGERGLAAGTVGSYLRVARSFCLALPAGPDGLGQLRACDVTAFVVATCRRSSTPLAKKTVTALASLLRYLHITGVTTGSFAFVVPPMAGGRAGPPPRAPETAQVAALLSSCDRRRSVGRRDYAILLLLARLGLRAGEVAKLTLDDIDWHHGELVVRGKGDRHERLPLPTDVGQAMAAYLRRGRPRAPQGRRLFLRAVAPPGPLTPSAVAMVVVRAARRAGLPELGPHRLRYGAATETLRRGAPLAEVAQLLRQRSLLVTAAYARVEPGALRELARPWPGGIA